MRQYRGIAVSEQRSSLIERRRATVLTALNLWAPRIRILYVTGLVLVLLGTGALAATGLSRSLSLVPIGILMAIAGLFELGLGHLGREEDAAVPPWMMSGGAQMVAALTAMVSPLLPSYVFSTVLGAALTFAGLSWLRGGFALPERFKSPAVIMCGGITGLVGLLIISRWAGTNVSLVALMLGLEMLMRGWAWIGFGFGISRALKKM